jgi:hypothetical protein
VGYGYVTAKMGTSLTGDPRDVALRDAIYGSIRAMNRPTAGASPAVGFKETRVERLTPFSFGESQGRETAKTCAAVSLTRM